MKNKFKFLTIVLCVAATVTLTSTTRNTDISVGRATLVAMPTCGGPASLWLTKTNSPKPLGSVQPSTTYYVRATGGTNNTGACVIGGTGYSISGTGCEDIGPGQSLVIATITTSSSLPESGITLQVETYCNPGVTTTYWPFPLGIF